MKVARVLSAEEAVFFHLRNTLDLFDGSFELTVIGPVTDEMRSRWPKVIWISIPFGRKISIWKDIVNFLRLIAVLYRGQYDIVHSLLPKTSLMCALAAFIARTPIRLHTFTGQVWATKTGFPRWALKCADKIVYALNTKCYADSASQAEFLTNEGLNFKKTPVTVLGDGSLAGINLKDVDTKSLQNFRNQFRTENNINLGQTAFIFLGRKTSEKGVNEILAAVEKLAGEDFRFKFVFVGPDEDQFVARVQNLSSSAQEMVLNIGRVNNPFHYLAAADVLVLPSYREGFGTVVIEAAALGKPAIGSRIVGLVDAIEDTNTGLLVKVKDAGELATAMKYYLNHPDVRMQMGENAQKRASEKFSAERLYSLLIAEYRTLAK